MSQDFSRVGPNSVRTPRGYIVETLGRTGVRIAGRTGTVVIDSEMLHAPMSIAVYSSTAQPLDRSSADDVLSETVAALQWLGFRVEVF